MTTVTQERHLPSNLGRLLHYPEPPPLGFIQEEKEYCNKWADYWRNEIGVNVMPAITKNKITKIKWAEYQDKPIPEWQHNQWKNESTFSEGLAIIPGRVWHREDRKDMVLYLPRLGQENFYRRSKHMEWKNNPLAGNGSKVSSGTAPR